MRNIDSGRSGPTVMAATDSDVPSLGLLTVLAVGAVAVRVHRASARVPR